MGVGWAGGGPLSIFRGMDLLTLPSKIDRPDPESHFWCFEITAVLLVRLWAATSCKAQGVGLSEAYSPKVKSLLDYLSSVFPVIVSPCFLTGLGP